MCPYNAMLSREERNRGPRQSDRSHDFNNYGLTAEQLAERKAARYAARLSEEAWENEGGSTA